ncbi:MAG: S-layer homology domain-containing protein [Clostridia bacterium]|nr:S-layer homology domain-containing protein [Clostridia bacterium]
MTTVVTFAKGAEFSDVSAEDYFYDAVQWGAENGITEGVGDNLFGSDGQVTRAQVVTFLWRMAGKPATNAATVFDDVERGSWYEVPVQWAVENGITVGTGEGTFSPDLTCSRAMCITLLYRLQGSPLDSYDFSKEVKIDDNSPDEDFILSMLKGMLETFRAGVTDVPVGEYYELPLVWAAFSGILTQDNTDASEGSVSVRPNDPCVRKEMISFLYQTNLLTGGDEQDVPMIYHAGAISIPIPQKYSEVLSIDINAALDGEGTLVTVAELASIEAAKAKGESYEGAGELFGVDRVSENTLHELLCSDMSGMEVLGTDSTGYYYIFRTPTDVRFERETNEKMYEDAEIWTELNDWANGVKHSIFAYSDNLGEANYTNTPLDMYLARIAYKDETNYTVSTTEFGPLDPGVVDDKYYAEYLLGGGFEESDVKEAPDGEYVVLEFPDEEIKFDFFKGDKNLVRETSYGHETFYKFRQADVATSTDTMLDWYEALAVDSGKKDAETALDAFEGDWHEEIAGRGNLTITKIHKTGKIAMISAYWPDSASVVYYWEATAYLTDDGEVEYSSGSLYCVEYDENGNGQLVSEDHENSGSFKINNEGKLVWNYSINGNEMSGVFVK